MGHVVMTHKQLLKVVEEALVRQGYPLRPHTSLTVRIHVDGGLLLAPRGASVTIDLIDEGDHHVEGPYR